MQKVYVDSNVFISYTLSEMDPSFRQLGQEAEDFFRKCKRKYCLVISNHTCNEIKKQTGLLKNDIFDALSVLGCTIEYFKPTNADSLVHDFQKQGIHTSDALHAALALLTKSTIFLTFNVKDFQPLKKFMFVCDPSELF